MLGRLVVATLIVHALPARADDDPVVPAPPPVTTGDHSSYRADLFAVDAISDFLILGGAAAGGLPSVVGLGGYLVGAPLIHDRHGHGGRAAASLALRVALPVAGIYLGSRTSSPDEDESFVAEAVFGLGGLVLAQTIDIAFLGGDDDDEPGPTRASIAPSIAATRGGFALGLGGSF